MEIKTIGSGSTGNCYVADDGCTRVLLDCGVNPEQIMRGIGFNPESIAACLITHSHSDHIKSARNMLYLGIRVFASAGCIEAAGIGSAQAVKSLVPFSAGSFDILPFGVEHDAPEPLGFLLKSRASGEKLLYFTDTCYLKYRFKGVTHMLCEANYDSDILRKRVSEGDVSKKLADRIISNHMSISSLLKFLSACDLAKLKAVYLCHLSALNSNAAEFKKRVQSATGAEVYVCENSQ